MLVSAHRAETRPCLRRPADLSGSLFRKEFLGPLLPGNVFGGLASFLLAQPSPFGDLLLRLGRDVPKAARALPATPWARLFPLFSLPVLFSVWPLLAPHGVSFKDGGGAGDLCLGSLIFFFCWKLLPLEAPAPGVPC